MVRNKWEEIYNEMLLCNYSVRHSWHSYRNIVTMAATNRDWFYFGASNTVRELPLAKWLQNDKQVLVKLQTNKVLSFSELHIVAFSMYGKI